MENARTSKSKDNTTELINDDLDVITDDRQMANAFNDYFISVGPNLAKSIDYTSPSPIQPQLLSICLKSTTYKEIEKIISHLKDSAAGDDQIKPKILKKVAHELRKPVCKIINLSFNKGHFPQFLKKSSSNTNIQSKKS